MKMDIKKVGIKGQRFLIAAAGYFLAGLFVPFLWSYFASPFGYLAGFVAAIIAIGPLWYLVHYKGMVQLKTGDIGVDMGFGIATAVFIRDALDYGWTGILKSFPTLLLVVIGAALGGFGAYYVERLLSKQREGKSDH